ncbi:hypothetical protein RCH16_001996 [Cryobacterium sp. MP_M5]|uniref:hypothetical protein n=1 Tax=unclassified Cryobacterium TaxID=2649013 RepID=UPI0018CAA5D6|nr:MULTISPECIES: hypothetical protein [unclassified Cryobacterium]MBG6059646.1 hypothetical protein [Cryobacterium sp. MP_M3]MEC5176986.1 hypothetical protein [Cryobacterium sp. MP_M5]
MSSAEQPEQQVPESGEGEILVDQTRVTMRRSPRYLNFMILGAVVGAILALVLTVSFPGNAEFAPSQVFGFLLLAGVVAGVTVGAVAAMVVDRVTGRSATTVVVDRLGAYGPSGQEAPDAPSDSPNSSGNSE